MTERWLGGLITRDPVVPTGGYFGSAPGVWTLGQLFPYIKAGAWPISAPAAGTGQLFGMGANAQGNLGIGDLVGRSSPVQVGAGLTWGKSIAAGSWHTLMVMTDGTLWAWGQQASGALGNGVVSGILSSPIQIGSLNTWLQVAASYKCSAAIKSDNTLWTWGLNNSGQLMKSNTTADSVPVQVGALTNWKQVSLGAANMGAVKTDGTLWMCGQGASGSLGIGNITNYSSPKQVGALTTWAAVSVSPNVGAPYTLAIKTDGTLWTWGGASSAKGTGNLTVYSSPVQVGLLTTWATARAGSATAVALKTDGTLWAWGVYPGDGTGVAKSSPVQVGALTTWAEVSIASDSVLALRADGTLWGWGANASGSAGFATLNVSSPLQVGTLPTWTGLGGQVSGSDGATAFAIRSPALPNPSAGTLWSWGNNSSGQVGDGTLVVKSVPVQVGALTTWSSVAVGYLSSMAIKLDGTLWTWGNGLSGQLGLSNTTTYSSPVQVGALTNWAKTPVSIIGSTSSRAAIKLDGTLWSWGQNSSGQLGLSNTTAYSSPKQVGALTNWATVSVGLNDMCAVKTDGTLWAWGGNQNGQLGLGNTTNYSSPKQVGALTNWKSVTCGTLLFTLAIKTDGTLWSWGQNSGGQLGLGNITYYSSPKQIGALTTWASVAAVQLGGMAIKTDGTLWCWGAWATNFGGVGGLSSPVQLGSSTNWALAAPHGGASTSPMVVALKTDGTAWSWGNNSSGQLGLGNLTSYISPKQVGGFTNWGSASVGGVDGGGNVLMIPK
jgi:alpha-tubulin suppressor-like RCC1 family protein